ncbi:unnamed protein product [Spirodela intermedia]|uniref:plant cystathionine gamma-synthase n=1 Tax=Spirodela intermedia TaxID=51605 RepID=A0A7I8ILC3_SPIIN|nr:unnamed protein product [Spirodela intermedia]CAA6658741.1 unnamed protein product [Spirodela intermedia]
MPSSAAPPFEARASDGHFSGFPSADGKERKNKRSTSSFASLRGERGGLSSAVILRFPPNFVRQLSTKARRNCSNIGVAHIVAASWTNKLPGASPPPPPPPPPPTPFGRGIVTDGITTPIVNTSAYWFKNSAELIDFKGRHKSFEYGRYGNPTTTVLEEKMSALERAESTLFVTSGMYASVAMLQTLVPRGGHMVTTTDCYRKTRVFIQNELPKKDISVTVIDPADMEGLKRALEENNVSLFFTESPTNPLFRCVDIELVSKLCHEKGALVCIDGTFATPINQKALPLGADLVLHSATKFIAGHNDVLAGCLSGSQELISKIRVYHHVVGGVLNPEYAPLFFSLVFVECGLHDPPRHEDASPPVQQHNQTALRMAQFLEEHPKIRRVYYPGLESHPEHHIARRQMTGFGGVVSFEVDGDLHDTIRFIDNLKIPYLAPSFGGCESIVDQPAIMSYWDLSQEERVKYGIKDNLVRFSFGVEDFDDLKADVVQALKYV